MFFFFGGGDDATLTTQFVSGIDDDPTGKWNEFTQDAWLGNHQESLEKDSLMVRNMFQNVQFSIFFEMMTQ